MKSNLKSETKYEWFLFYFIILLSLSFTLNNKSDISKTNISAKSKTNLPLRNYYWIQRLYPGTDPMDNIKESEFNSEKKFLEINDEVIFMAKSLDTISEIEDSINIGDIFDSKNDNVGRASCCSRVTYEEFPAGNSLQTIIPAIKSTIKGKSLIERAKSKAKGSSATCGAKSAKASLIPITSSSPVNTPSPSRKESKKFNNPEIMANFCILIFIPDEARWRVCSNKKNEITKLHLKIVYSVLKLKSNSNQNILEKLINNPSGLTTPNVGNWNWDEQQKWSGKCKSGIMQSPFNYSKASVKKPGKNFSMSMQLTNVHTLIKKNFGEIIIVFLNFAGILKIDIDNTFLLFTPQYISFRFPGETIIDGVRSMGDMQIHFVELSKNRRTATTNGLILNVPLKPNNKKTSIEEFDELNLEFWRHEVIKKGVYTPKKFMKKQLSIFSLGGISKKIIDNKPNFMINMGSETIPPCVENVIHITLDKPLEIPGCQFKLLRESSLISSRAKEIHTRVEMPSNERPIYKFDTRSVSYIQSIDGLVPLSYNQYLLKYGYGYMYRLGQKRGRFGWYGKGGKWWKRFGKGRFGKSGKFGKRGFGPGYRGGKLRGRRGPNGESLDDEDNVNGMNCEVKD